MEVDLHVTNRCNLRCTHCVYDSGTLVMPDMTIKDVLKMIDSFKKMNAKEIHLTGGEPLLNEEIFDIIALLHEEKFIVRLQSNGMVISSNAAKRLKQAGLDHVLISIDGTDEEHNNFRQNSLSFKKAIEAIKHCLNENIYTRVNTVLHKKNVDQIKPLLEATSALNIDQHSFFYLTPIGRGQNLIKSVFTLFEWKDVKEKILKTAKSLNFSNKIKVQDVYQKSYFPNNHCRLYSRDNCLIMSNKDVYPCVFFVGSPYCLGNLEEKSLIDIWTDLTTWKKFFPKRTKNCAQIRCDGGCRGLTYLLTGDIQGCDPRCNPKENMIPNCIRRYANE